MNDETIFKIIFFSLLFCIFIIRGYYARKVRKSGGKIFPIDKCSVKREGKFRMTLKIISWMFLIFAITIYGMSISSLKWLILPFPFWLRWIGVILGFVCPPLLFWIHYTLDKYGSTELELRNEHVLITNGPYRWIRHPMYLTLYSLLIALFLISANLLFFLPCFTVIFLIFLRIRKEENMMIERFGDEYRDYMKHTGRLLPCFIRNSD